MTIRRRIGLAVVLLAATAVIWFLALPPSLDRDWTPEHARHPRVNFDGDQVTIDNVRNFRFSPDARPTGSWETRTYDLRRVDSLWYGLSVFNPDGWRGPAHGLFSFGFDDGSYLAVSVEARKERGEPYGVYRGLLRTFELIYVVGDERDLLLDRATARPDDVYLFPVDAPAHGIRDLLVALLREGDRLGREPDWYNTLWDNCTSRLHDHVEEVAPDLVPPTWRVILPGYTDELMAGLGLLGGDADLDEARRIWRINDRARAVGDTPDFSAAIRDTSGVKGQVP